MSAVAVFQGDTSTTSPTASLNLALVDFESVLTDEQKQQYRSTAIVPDVSDVIDFVTQIDERRQTTRRCVASRLCTFLESTQQFSGVMDTFVSSNPTIAALVWGGVKTAILATNNVASYFEKVTELLMRMGKLCPTYQQFGELYPGYIGLQQALCDYYAVIVHLCAKLVEVSRRTTILQTISSVFVPFEAEFKPFLEKLDQAAADIGLQTSLASKQADYQAKKLLALETRENAAFRPQALNFYKRVSKEYAETQQWRMDKLKRDNAKLRSLIRDNLSTVKHIKAWKQAMQLRVPSTAGWLIQEPIFDQWKSSPETAILWCPGTLGVGKTVLMSNVVSHLHTLRNPDAIISYYFCRADEVAALSARSIWGCLARQLLNSQIEQLKDKSLAELHENTQDLDTNEVIELLLTRLDQSKLYFCVIDGLDECDSFTVRQVGKSLTRLRGEWGRGLKFLFSGRPDLETQLFRSTEPHVKIPITGVKLISDMELYIETMLSRSLEAGNLKVGDPMVVVEISKALQERSQGMFLWTRLCIEEICAQDSDDAILKALKHLPQGLAEIFDQKLRRIEKFPGAEHALRMLRFCGVAKRPLNIQEYQESLSLSPTQKMLDPRKFPNDLIRVIGNCCGLVFADEEDSTIHFIHPSVKEHLFTHRAPRTAKFEMWEIDRHFGILCMVYLDFNDFKHQLVKAQRSSSTQIHPVQIGTFAVHQSSNTANRLASKLVPHLRQLRRLSTQQMERKAQDLLGEADSLRLDAEIRSRNFHFFDYARMYWIYHLPSADVSDDERTWRLFCRCVDGDDVPAIKPWLSDAEHQGWDVNLPKAIRWLLENENISLLRYLVQCQPQLLTESKRRDVISGGIDKRCSKFLDVIIQLKSTTTKDLYFGILHAAETGDYASVEMLCSAGGPDIRWKSRKSALAVAAEHGHVRIVELLISKKYYSLANAEAEKCAALGKAAANGHLEVMEFLLARINSIDTPVNHLGETALQVASAGGHLAAVWRLLRSNAQVDNIPFRMGEVGRTAIQHAVQGGHVQVAEVLLAHLVLPSHAAGDTAWPSDHRGHIKFDLTDHKFLHRRWKERMDC